MVRIRFQRDLDEGCVFCIHWWHFAPLFLVCWCVPTEPVGHWRLWLESVLMPHFDRRTIQDMDGRPSHPSKVACWLTHDFAFSEALQSLKHMPVKSVSNITMFDWTAVGGCFHCCVHIFSCGKQLYNWLCMFVRPSIYLSLSLLSFFLSICIFYHCFFMKLTADIRLMKCLWHVW